MIASKIKERAIRTKLEQLEHNIKHNLKNDDSKILEIYKEQIAKLKGDK